MSDPMDKNASRYTGPVYPSPPTPSPDGLTYKIAIIADLDAASKCEGEAKFFSFYKTGHFTISYNPQDPGASSVSVAWDAADKVIKSTMNLGGRGMELSELNVFHGQLYTMDDRTGVIFRLLQKGSGELAPVPWVILGDGDGHISKGMKCEWGAVKDDHFYVGSTGMPNYNRDGSILNHDTQWVKKISEGGSVEHVDWRRNYSAMAESLGITPPGYVKHESGGWSETLKRWVFLPRRACKEAFTTDEEMGTNIILLCTEDFEDIEVRTVGDIIPTHGFSSFKWVPGTDDQIIVALKTVEVGDMAETYIMVFDIQGHILMEETKIADQKYEGIEFV